MRYEFETTGEPDFGAGKGAPGHGRLYIDEKPVGQAEIPVTIPFTTGITGGLNVGALPGATMVPEFTVPFAFTGTIHSVTVDVSGELITDTSAEMRIAMARQ